MKVQVEIPVKELEDIKCQIANEERFSTEYIDEDTGNYIVLSGTADYEEYRERETCAVIDTVSHLVAIVNIYDSEGDEIDFDNETEANIFKQLTDYLYD